MIESSLRLTTQGKLDCTNEGMKLGRAIIEIFFNRIEPNEDLDLDEVKNLVMIAQDLIRRCNYLSSIEGLVVGKLIR